MFRTASAPQQQHLGKTFANTYSHGSTRGFMFHRLAMETVGTPPSAHQTLNNIVKFVKIKKYKAKETKINRGMVEGVT